MKRQFRKVDFGICLLLGPNHAKRVPEFIAYHNIVGAEKFYIYFNEDVNKWHETWHYFQPFVESGIAEVIPYQFKTIGYPAIQLAAYHECLFKAKGKVKWLGFLDADEFFQLQPTSQFSSIVDLCNSFDGSNTLRFSTVFYAYEGNASKYIEQCSYPSFISDWLLNKLERQKRLPKSIHLTDETEHLTAHLSTTLSRKSMGVPVTDAVLAHYRYPYKQYTDEGLQDGSYKKNETFKVSFSKKIFQKLLDFSFPNLTGHCEVKNE